MRTMYYLLTIVFALLSSACTTENVPAEEELTATELRGRENNEPRFYLELDFHQGALAYEDEQLRILMLAIQEEMENGNNERQGLFEESQERRALIEEFRSWNSEILFRGPIGPGSPPPRCVPDDKLFKPCPLPKSALDNLYLSTRQFPEGKSKVEVFDVKGRLVGRMQGTTPVPESEGAFVKAEMDYDSRRAYEIRITKLDFMGKLETTIYLYE